MRSHALFSLCVLQTIARVDADEGSQGIAVRRSASFAGILQEYGNFFLLVDDGASISASGAIFDDSLSVSRTRRRFSLVKEGRSSQIAGFRRFHGQENGEKWRTRRKFVNKQEKIAESREQGENRQKPALLFLFYAN